MTVAIENGFGGVIFHEACGHSLEATSVGTGTSEMAGKLGQKIANEKVTAIDDGTIPGAWGSVNIDDEGHPTQRNVLIENGVLKSYMIDRLGSRRMGMPMTGNGRRESYSHKAYARMTNTFFEKGKDKLEDMIASIDHGYMLFETSNGMEDPKTWAIQCVAEYGIEIVDGKLTDNYVSPVVMSGYVPELLGSISMISDDFKVIGSGMCGKGYKEWVRVSDGGPALKVKVKLG